MKILIPTCLSRDDVLISAIERMILTQTPDVEIFASCLDASAAVNRNACLAHIEVGDVSIMLDDDISGFYPTWIDDLMIPFSDPAVIMSSARLLNEDGTFGPTCSRCYEPSPDEIEIFSNGGCVLPTAAIAFRHLGLAFDEAYKGSGFEDSDWCMQYLKHNPAARFIQSNRCRLIHKNLMRNQKGQNWSRNRQYFTKKWHGRVVV